MYYNDAVVEKIYKEALDARRRYAASRTDMNPQVTPEFLKAIKDGYNNPIFKYPYSQNRGFIISIKNVIFNPPATIVIWNDGTKTVVKAENEPFDKEKGLAMAICKRTSGNRGRYFDVFRKWCHDDESMSEKMKTEALMPSPAETIQQIAKSLEEEIESVGELISEDIKDVE